MKRSPSQAVTDNNPASRYVVGIDLGTTNSAVCYIDTQQQPWQIQVLAIPQLVDFGQVEARDTLPSFLYQPVVDQLETESLKLPWPKSPENFSVGVLAREEGARSPDRLVVSAKSWLCHSGVDRTAELLPWQGASELSRFSPAAVSSHYLSHLRAAWDHQFPRTPLAEQEIILTLPASFDEVARELTIAAAAQAKLPRVVLIEEPQAAFYAWVYEHTDNWQEQVQAGQTILVCDIGGGTSDLTLIQARPVEQVATENLVSNHVEDQGDKQGTIRFHRVAVGNHLILGGDNLDLALAHHLESRLAEEAAAEKLTTRQWDVLVRSCRRVKESLLSGHSGAPEVMMVHLPGTGARLLGGGLQIEVTRTEVESLLLDGFLPAVPLEEKPTVGATGFRQFGLPYAQDPAITRHLAAFLSAHGKHLAQQRVGVSSQHAPEDPSSLVARPDAVLLNGGFFASPVLRDRLLAVLSGWFSDSEQAWSPQLLTNDRLDLAVAQGAAYYGMVCRGEGVRIAANLARSYYLGVAGKRVAGSSEEVAVCLVPGDAEAGQQIDLEELKFDLTVSQPVEFSLYVSSTRLTDRPGELIPIDPEQLVALPPIRTVLHSDRRRSQMVLPVTLHARLSEIGTVEMWCQGEQAHQRWRLQFDIRSCTQTDQTPHAGIGEQEGHLPEAIWEACEEVLMKMFASEADEKPSALMQQLTNTMGLPKSQWPASFLRRIWEQLLQLEAGRRRSAAHEARWLNLLGYSLRPGYGLAVDDWRVAETWRTVCDKLCFPASHAECWVLWRRIAGGLTVAQQVALAEPILSSLRAAHTSSMTGKRTNPSIPMSRSSEAWRLLGSLELLEVPVKVQVANSICDLLPKRKYENVRRPMIWALGRLGQRVPLHGPLNTVVPSQHVLHWIETLMAWDEPESLLAVMQLARRTDDRHRDLTSTDRDETVRWLTQNGAAEHLVELVQDGGQLASDEQDRLFGEALPKGLSWVG